MKKHLHASRREHNSGLGTDRRDTTGVVGADWTRNAKNFDAVLKGLESYTKKVDFDEDDEDGSKGGGGDKKKDKKEKKKKRRKRRTRKQNKTLRTFRNDRGVRLDTRGDIINESGEKMREYSYDDLNAILGGGAFGGLEEVRANHDSDDDRKDSDASNDRKVDDDDIRKKDDDDDDGKRKKKKSSKKEKKNKKRMVVKRATKKVRLRTKW